MTENLPDIKSKSQVKRDFDTLRGLVRDVVELPESQRRQLALPSDIDDALANAAHMTKGALQRQIRYITGLMGDSDSGISREELQRRLLILKRPSRKATAQLHNIEQWRDRLLSTGDTAIDALTVEYPEADRQQIRQLVRNARHESTQNKSPRAARRLFHMLKALMSEKAAASQDTNTENDSN